MLTYSPLQAPKSSSSSGTQVFKSQLPVLQPTPQEMAAKRLRPSVIEDGPGRTALYVSLKEITDPSPPPPAQPPIPFSSSSSYSTTSSPALMPVPALSPALSPSDVAPEPTTPSIFSPLPLPALASPPAPASTLSARGVPVMDVIEDMIQNPTNTGKSDMFAEVGDGVILTFQRMSNLRTEMSRTLVVEPIPSFVVQVLHTRR